MKVHIISYFLLKNDAVGNFCVDLGRLLSSIYDVRYYADNSTVCEVVVNKISTLQGGLCDNDLILYSYSIYDPNLDYIVKLSNRKICYFHNVTPPHFFLNYDDVTFDLCDRSSAQIPSLSLFDLIITNSCFSESFLKSFGVFTKRKIIIKPPVFKHRLLETDLSFDSVDNDGLSILYVGRIVPHKKIEDIIDLFYELHKVNTEFRLKIAGKHPIPKYSQELLERVERYNLASSIEFLGSVDQSDLVRLYQTSDIFLMMSEHEGFCIPVLEALFFGLKVFVTTGSASSEIAGDFGFLLNRSNVDDMNLILKNIGKDDSILKKKQYVNELLEKNSLDSYLQLIEGLLCD
jgi:glycosyltransferase involved in cell wall biosynthesis